MAHLKILLAVHQFFPRGYHGTERYTLDLATELTRAGHEMVILTATHSAEDSSGEDIIDYEYNGLRVRAIDLAQNSRQEFSASYHRPDLDDLFARILLEERPDVVHCAHLLFLGVSFLDVVRHTDCPIVFTMTDFFGICWTSKLLTCGGKNCRGPAQNNDNCVQDVLGSLPNSHPEPVIRWSGRIVRSIPFLTPLIEIFLKTPRFQKTWYPLIDGIRKRRGIIEGSYRSVDHFIVATPVLEEKYRQYGLKDRVFTRLPFGITQPTADEISFLRARYEQLRSTNRPLVFGFIGQIAQHKGVDLLIRAFANVRPANTRLHIVGDLQQDTVFAKELQAIANDQDAIKFLPPFPSPRVYDVLGTIDVLVLPSIWSENAPLILLNSLASRTFVATSDVAGMSQFLEPEATGLLFAAKSSQAIEKVLIRAAMLRSLLLDRFDAHPGYPISPSSYARQVVKIYDEQLTRRFRNWNEPALREIAASRRVRPVKWRPVRSGAFKTSDDARFDWNTTTASQVIVDQIGESRFKLKTLSRDSFLLLEKLSSGNGKCLEVLAKWSISASSVVYYAVNHDQTFAEDKRALLTISKGIWMLLRFDFSAINPPIQAFRWHLAHNAEGVEVEIETRGELTPVE
jgi:glycosyltransferase involved in cell wall biosynthesis